MIPTSDFEASTGFFVEVLGFTHVFSSPTYRICEKDNLTVHFLRAGDDIGQMEIYLEVDDVDAVWRSIESRVGHLKHRAPFNQDYGMREIHIEVPATKCLLYIGQCIPEKR